LNIIFYKGDFYMKKLYRSRTNRMFFGVCGGIAEYLGADPTVVRLLWVLGGLMVGLGIIFYIAAALIIPESI
jgi:phage shock protein PspC (stress-responsive transcriptional regulator)